MCAVQIPPLDFVFSVLLSYSCVLVLYNLLLCQGESEMELYYGSFHILKLEN